MFHRLFNDTDSVAELIMLVWDYLINRKMIIKDEKVRWRVATAACFKVLFS
jgi:hypothetical protein